MPAPASALSNVAVALLPTTSVTPLGSPDVSDALKPLSTAALVPSATFCADGKTSIRCAIAAPSVSTNSLEKSVGVVYETGL